MIDIEKAKKEFKKYVSNYDVQNPEIERKILHTYRVSENSKEIAKRLNLNEEQQKLAELIGILHDIGRFEQQTKYKNYDVISNFDHGDFGAELLTKELRNYISDDKYDNIIIKAVKNHNKYKIEENLTKEELLFAKLIRDADKLDILYECTDIFWKGKEELIENSKISKEIHEAYCENQSVKKEKDKKYNEIDGMFITLAYTFDINYKQSYEIIKEQDYINKTVSRFNFKDFKTEEEVNELIKILNIYIQNKIDEG